MLASPYDSKLVDGIKTIPGRARAWMPEAKVWLVEREYVDTLRGLCGRLYWETAFCDTCWLGKLCPHLAELAGLVGAVHLTSLPAPAPSPPWPPEPPKTLDEAARLLGVALDADERTVKKAARRLAAEAHPDRAGEQSAPRMRAILVARDLLLAER